MNGRIAIVDDKYDDVKCLLSDLSKHQIPYRFYHFEGNPEVLPDAADGDNDFRILIMDLNLINDGVLDSKTLISSLLPILSRLIPTTNYPYVFAYWSKHEDEHRDIIEKELFQKEELIHKQPIAFVNLDKSKYISMTGEPTTAPIKIFEEICTQLDNLAAYKALLHWENIIHTSADTTIQDVFCFDSGIGGNWSDNSLDLLTRFSKANIGKNSNNSNDAKKSQAAISVLNPIFSDTCDKKIHQEIQPINGLYKSTRNKKINTSNLNSKLLLDFNIVHDNAPGTVSKLNGFNMSGFITTQFDEERIEKFYKTELGQLSTRVEKNAFINKLKDDTIKSAFLIQVCVDAICDYTNQKVRYSRYIDGAVILNSSKEQFYDNEASFKSPPFIYNETEYFLLLNNQYFSSVKADYSQPIFRIREQMLAEIQSKLARHISRQGMLSL